MSTPLPVEFRTARPEDADQVVPLMWESSRGLIDTTMSAVPGGPAALLRRDFLRGRGIFGHRQQLLAVAPGGEVLATITLYRGRRYQALSLQTLLSSARFGPACLAAVLRRSLAVSRLFAPPSPDCLFIANLSVLPEHRSRGYGSLILREADRVARDTGLTGLEGDVSISNTRAWALYQRLGFESLGERHDSRGTGLDGFRRMRRPVLRPTAASGSGDDTGSVSGP
ncbi:GNAT family N-acetyltransferase [Streptomyces sp. HNM0575]|uniref:GNAT family N-acetyltransferase n=1 Tax=Streptomyces sp. HNM0575 TaxID=2716338 RepID=UPI00145D8CD1|nr:GNAT family N-acetyltransferase [Streptomyces sp. HNM0575]NLU76227.1 GNAT family N-acetyltransferase [Streptomyces sp. HNM0575]